MKIEIDEEELLAILDFQRSMAEGALESGDDDELIFRLMRIGELKTALKKLQAKRNEVE